MEIWALPMKYHRICCVTQGLCVPSPQNENYQAGHKAAGTELTDSASLAAGGGHDQLSVEMWIAVVCEF